MFLSFFGKNCCIWLLVLIVGGAFSDEVTIGSGATGTSYIPLEVNQNYSYTQQIYLQSEINTGGSATITEVHFYWDGGGSGTRTIVLYMAHTSISSFSDETDWVTSGLTQVYSGSYSLTTSAGWHQITLDNSFVYNNSDNLLIAVDDNTGSTSTTHEFFLTDQGTDRTLYNYQSTDISPSSPPDSRTSYNTMVADVKLVYTAGGGSTSYTWDANSSEGIQAGGGTFDGSAYWTDDGGTTRIVWPGSGNATFAGSDGSEGSYQVDLAATAGIDSLTFLNSGYHVTLYTLNFGSNSGIYVASGDSAEISSAIAGTGGIELYGGGKLIILGTSHTYTGGTRVINGTLKLGNSSGDVTISGPITNNDALVFDLNQGQTYSDIISGPGTLDKEGSATLTLSANNTYTGTTTVSAGELRITGSISSGSAVNVAVGATLSGTGTIGGTVAASGAIAPGTTGYRTLTIGNSLTFSSSGSLSAAIGGATAGTNYDQVVMSTGTLTLGSAALSLTLNYVPGASDAYTLINNTGPNAVSGTFNGYPQGSTITLTYNSISYNFTISYTGGTGNDVVLTSIGETPIIEYYATWNYSGNIYINTTASGANVSGNVLNFPLLVRLNTSNFNFSKAMSNGYDIRFSKSDISQHLSYERERWSLTASDSVAEFWVLCDTVYGNNSTQYIKIHWGKAGANDMSRSEDVFKTINGFWGVYHLDSTTTDDDGSTRPYKDATSNARHGADYVTSNIQTGIINKGQEFYPGNDHILLGTANPSSTDLTMSIWINWSGSSGSSQTILSKYNNWDESTMIWWLALYTDSIFLWQPGSKVDFDVALPKGEWTYLTVVTKNGTSNATKLYIEGKQVGNSHTYTFGTGHTSQVRIGGTAETNRSFNGLMDEVRIENTIRSADWIKLSYENQKSSQSVTTVFQYYTGTSPVITGTYPSDTAIATGQTLIVAAYADAIPTPQYTWYVKPSPYSDSVVVSNGPVLTLSDVTKLTNGYYFFTADNGYGKVKSNTIAVYVANPVAITIDLPNNLPVVNNGSILLNPDVSGDGTITYQWYENNNLLPGDTGSSFSITTIDSASHHGSRYMCKISNTYMNMQISTVSTRVCTLQITTFHNPFKVKAERIPIQNMERVRVKLWSDIDLSNFPCKDPVFPPSPWADSIWVFYQTNSYATDPSQAAKALFSTEQIKHAQDTLFDTLTVGLLPNINDSSFWFNYSILWHNPTTSIDTLLRPLIEANRVFMVDTIASPNPLVVYGEYIMKTDSVILTIDRITNLSISQDSLVAVQCSYYPQFNVLTKDITLSVETLLNGGDQYTLYLDSIGPLPLQQSTLYCRWFIIGKNNIQGTFKNTSFTVGWSRPVYTGTLIIDSTLMGNTILATWDPHTQSVDNLRIWWDTSPIPLVHNVQLPEDQAHYVTSLTTNMDTIKGLTNNTVYYFGLQILKDSLWSQITSQVSVQGKTAMGDTSTIPNTIKIDTSWFHDSTNSMVIQCHVDLLNLPPNKTAEVGYTFTLNDLLDTSMKPLKWYPATVQTQVMSIPLYPDITFDTVNTVGIWLRGVDSLLGPGFPNPPTDSSTTKVSIPSFTWQEVTFFPDGVDTVYAANKRILFVKEFFFTETDTLWSFNPDTIPNGFVQAGGTGFRFGNKSLQVPSFTIGLKYNILTPDVKPDDLGIYQYKNGDLHILHGFYVDSEAVWNTISLEHFQYPLLILADTIAPTVTVKPFNDTIPQENTVTNEFQIIDNNANTFWQFLYGAGHEGYPYQKHGYISERTSDSLKIEIKNRINLINPLFGFRAIIVAFDGVSADTFNVSRSIRSNKCGTIIVNKQEWIPLGTPAHLDVPQLDKIFDNSIDDILPWEYNQKDLRLFRWYNQHTKSRNSWLEYSDSSRDEFSFIPGRLIWCKAFETEAIAFGKGVSLSLKKPFELHLKPEDWTDICIPFKFDIMLRDILETTGVDESKNLDVFHWQKMNKTFEAVDLFAGSIDSIADIKDTVNAQHTFNGYTIYNHSKSPLILRIPPTCLLLSQYAKETTRTMQTSVDSWNISIKWKNKEDATYRRLRCGYKKGMSTTNTYGPLPPSMSKMNVGILNHEHVMCSWSIKPTLNRGGIYFEVVFRNNSDTDKDIEYFLDNLEALPENFSAKVLNPETNTYESINGKRPLTMLCGSRTSTRRTVAIGTKQFLNMMVSAYLPLKLVKAYPNPFYKRFKISYRIPIGIKEVQFILYNLRGQRLWRHTEKTIATTPGYQIFSFDGKTNGLKNGIVPSGVYILQLKATNTSGLIVYGGEKHLTCIK